MARASEFDASDATVADGATPSRTFAAGRYVAVRALPEGGQKTVYLVRDTALDRDCALALIKSDQLAPGDVARLRREAQAMARLGAHANVVSVYDIGDDDGRPYMVCEYVEGGDLRRALDAAGGRLPLERTLAVGRDVCAALAAAHARGVVHRDIKPSNVWLTEDGTAKLGDFGLAFAVDRSRLTIEGGVMGTAAYMPPEQALGQTADARSDLYALGCVLYELVAGHPPFAGDDAVAVISQHIHTAPVAPSWHQADVPRALETLILRLLAKSPDERPQSATEAGEALAAIESAPPATAVQASPERQNPLDRLAGGVFVGREVEVETLRAALDDALSGKGGLVLLVGEPGIGKTRTANELATYAQLRGAQVLVGRCFESEGAPPYWPWVQALRSYVQEARTSDLKTEMGAGAADIAQIVTEVHERIPGLAPPPQFEPEQARFRLFDSIAAFLKNASRRRPLVLLLDDLHWADKASLLMLQFLARDLGGARLLVLGTYRDVELGRQHPLAQTLAELAREQVGTRVLLRGLGEPEVARYIEMTSGIAPPEALVAAVYRETEGNPFFLSEVVRLLVADGRLNDAGDTRSWTVTIPQSVREVVGRRLDHLSQECNRVLTTAAVVGREFGLDALERLTQLDADALLALVEEAEAARVVEEVQGQRTVVGRYSFSHALIRETLYEELSTTRRVRLHKQIGETLESLYAASVEPHLSELAYHFGEAAAAGEAIKAVDYAKRAGDRAMELLGYEEATRLYQAALHAYGSMQAPDESLRCELSIALATAYWGAGQPSEAWQIGEQAAAAAKKAGTPEQLARAAMSYGGRLYWGTVTVEAEAALLRDALAALGPEDSVIRTTIMARLAHVLTSYPEEQEHVALGAVEMARRVADPGALAYALRAQHIAIWDSGAPRERLALAEESLRLAERAGDLGLAGHARIYILIDLLELGQIQRWDAEMEALSELRDRLRQPLFRYFVARARPLRSMMRGRFAEAEALALEVHPEGRKMLPIYADGFLAGQLLPIRRDQGRIHELEASLREMLEHARADLPNVGTQESADLSLSLFQSALALLHSELGRRDEARHEFELLAVNDFAGVPKDMYWSTVMTLLADVCASLSDAGRAATLYDALSPYATRNILSYGDLMACFGSGSRVLGLLATTMSHYEDAERHFEEALALNTRMGARPWITRTQHDYAKMLLARGRPDDRARAHALVEDALVEARDMGQDALVTNLETLQAQIGGSP